MYKYPDDPSLTGHFMIAINLAAIMGEEELGDRMAEFVETVKGSPMWDENREMLLPGELEHRTAEGRMKNGIPLPENLYQELIALGDELGATSQLPVMS
jgi:LDH2 family malate/lactate/ureidoglycolate dehydrogenase